MGKKYLKDDHHLIEGCKKNDQGRQKALYDKYCKQMYSTAYRILGNFDDAGDILQDSFLQVFKDIGKFRGEGPLYNWIKTIVVRNALKKLKKEKTFNDLEVDNHDVIISPVNLYDGEYLEKAILSLPARSRTVFLLIEVEGYAHKDVAEMLSISTGTTKSQLHHAKKLLQKKLSVAFEIK